MWYVVLGARAVSMYGSRKGHSLPDRFFNGSSIHLTTGNTSASVVLSRVYEAILIEMSSTFGISMGAQLQDKSRVTGTG